MIQRTVSLLAFLLLLGACGGDAPTKAERTQAALERLFAAVRAGDLETAAAHIVYRGADGGRKWKTVYDAAVEGERALVQGVVDEIKQKLGDGTPEFLEFIAEAESEGEWLAWKVKTGKGTYLFACLDIGGQIALGDID